MGLFKPLNESIHDSVNRNQHSVTNTGKGLYLKQKQNAAFDGDKNHKAFSNKIKDEMKNGSAASKHLSKYATGKFRESTTSLLGLTDEEVQELNEGNCNSDTCKCKGGTCPVSVTDGISTSSYAAKKLANAGYSNQTDLNAVKPNAEYNQQNDAKFIGDGDSPETSKTNIPAILAAKTAGGAPHGWTTDNGINGTGPNVFKLKKLKDDVGVINLGSQPVYTNPQHLVMVKTKICADEFCYKVIAS